MLQPSLISVLLVHIHVCDLWIMLKYVYFIVAVYVYACNDSD